MSTLFTLFVVAVCALVALAVLSFITNPKQEGSTSGTILDRWKKLFKKEQVEPQEQPQKIDPVEQYKRERDAIEKAMNNLKSLQVNSSPSSIETGTVPGIHSQVNAAAEALKKLNEIAPVEKKKEKAKKGGKKVAEPQVLNETVTPATSKRPSKKSTSQKDGTKKVEAEAKQKKPVSNKKGAKSDDKPEPAKKPAKKKNDGAGKGKDTGTKVGTRPAKRDSNKSK